MGGVWYKLGGAWFKCLDKNKIKIGKKKNLGIG